MCFEIEMYSLNTRNFKLDQTTNDQIFSPQISRYEIGLTLEREELR